MACCPPRECRLRSLVTVSRAAAGWSGSPAGGGAGPRCLRRVWPERRSRSIRGRCGHLKPGRPTSRAIFLPAIGSAHGETDRCRNEHWPSRLRAPSSWGLLPQPRTRAMPQHLTDDLSMGQVGLAVRDLDRSLGFYGDRLGLGTLERAPGRAVLGAGPRPLLELVERRGGERDETEAGLFHVALRVPDRAALAGILRRLLAADVALTGASDHLVSEALYLDDPDRHGLEIYADRPRDGWFQGGKLRLATLPLDGRDLLAAAEAPTGLAARHRRRPRPSGDPRSRRRARLLCRRAGSGGHGGRAPGPLPGPRPIPPSFGGQSLAPSPAPGPGSAGPDRASLLHAAGRPDGAADGSVRAGAKDRAGKRACFQLSCTMFTRVGMHRHPETISCVTPHRRQPLGCVLGQGTGPAGAMPAGRHHAEARAGGRRRAEHRHVARVPDAPRRLRGAGRAQRPRGAGRRSTARRPTCCCST